MKNVIYLIIGFFLLISCQTDELEPDIQMINFYEIKDVPGDSVQHSRYEIYTRYGVPVYFNDTIGRTFIKTDIHGDSVFIWETLDLNWTFSGHASTKYVHTYLTDPSKQMQALRLVGTYLDKAGKPLYPFDFFITDSTWTKGGNKVAVFGGWQSRKVGNKVTYFRPVAHSIYYRTILFANCDGAAGLEDVFVTDVIKRMVSLKMKNYETQLAPFYMISKREWFDRFWGDIDKTIEAGFSAGALAANYVWPPSVKTEEEKEAIRTGIRVVTGKYGFVGGGKNTGYQSPDDDARDLETFLTEILSVDRQEFVRRWGASPLVMQKYEILYDIIVNELKVEL